MSAAQNGTDAGYNFARMEGLGDIVIRANFETYHAVNHVTLAGDHHNGAGVTRLDACGQCQPVFAAKKQVESHQIDAAQSQAGIHAGAVMRLADAKTFPFETITQKLTNVRVVIDNQNVRRGGGRLKHAVCSYHGKALLQTVTIQHQMLPPYRTHVSEPLLSGHRKEAQYAEPNASDTARTPWL